MSSRGGEEWGNQYGAQEVEERPKTQTKLRVERVPDDHIRTLSKMEIRERKELEFRKRRGWKVDGCGV